MTDIKKSCTSCGGDGHHWNECQAHNIHDALHKVFGLEPLLGWQANIPETMTDIDKLAREIADKANRQWLSEEVFNSDSAAVIAARLGILEGMKLQRERDAVIAEGIDLFDDDKLKNSDPRTTIAAAIRSAL